MQIPVGISIKKNVLCTRSHNICTLTTLISAPLALRLEGTIGLFLSIDPPIPADALSQRSAEVKSIRWRDRKITAGKYPRAHIYTYAAVPPRRLPLRNEGEIEEYVRAEQRTQRGTLLSVIDTN